MDGTCTDNRLLAWPSHEKVGRLDRLVFSFKKTLFLPVWDLHPMDTFKEGMSLVFLQRSLEAHTLTGASFALHASTHSATVIPYCCSRQLGSCG